MLGAAMLAASAGESCCIGRGAAAAGQATPVPAQAAAGGAAVAILRRSTSRSTLFACGGRAAWQCPAEIFPQMHPQHSCDGRSAGARRDSCTACNSGDANLGQHPPEKGCIPGCLSSPGRSGAAGRHQTLQGSRSGHSRGGRIRSSSRLTARPPLADVPLQGQPSSLQAAHMAYWRLAGRGPASACSWPARSTAPRQTRLRGGGRREPGSPGLRLLASCIHPPHSRRCSTPPSSPAFQAIRCKAMARVQAAAASVNSKVRPRPAPGPAAGISADATVF